MAELTARGERRAMTMRTLTVLTFALSTAATFGACAPQETGTLQTATKALGATEVRSIEYSGTGRWFQFGQAPGPTLPWPAFDVSNFTASVNYETPAARVEMARIQVVEPGRARPAPVEQHPVQVVSGTYAWNMATPPGAAPDAAPAPQPQVEAVEERTMEIWTTPHGFLKAAAANNATSQPANGGSDVSFTVGGKHRYVGRINAQNQVERVQTWIDNTVLGDTNVEIEKLADGVYYVKGGSHHSVAIDQRDHIVVIEAPQNEARSTAVIAKVKETIPNKPIRYLINTHAHFDHSGGLRTYVDEGATIVTHAGNKPYYEQAWAAPRTINPDRLARSAKRASFETFTDKHVMTDGRRTIEIHQITGGGHNDAFAMVYLPAEKILIEVDAYTPAAAGTPPPATPNPFAVNLYDNIQRLRLDVGQIAALHGPRVATMADLRAFIRQPNITH